MPIYEYQCPKCGHVFEDWVHFSDAPEARPCPKCGTSAPHILSNTSFVLKGGGWYVTDYGNRKNTPDASGGEAPTSAPAADSPAKSTPPSKTTPAKNAGSSPPPAPKPAAPKADL